MVQPRRWLVAAAHAILLAVSAVDATAPHAAAAAGITAVANARPTISRDIADSPAMLKGGAVATKPAPVKAKAEAEDEEDVGPRLNKDGKLSYVKEVAAAATVTTPTLRLLLLLLSYSYSYSY